MKAGGSPAKRASMIAPGKAGSPNRLNMGRSSPTAGRMSPSNR